MERRLQGEGEVTSTGLSIIPYLPWGSHCCLFYRSKGDLYDAAVSFFKAGLENGERCVWIVADTRAARSALRTGVAELANYEQRGQIELVEGATWYAHVDGHGGVDEWIEHERRALDAGFTGVRASGDTFGVDRRAWPSFLEYESAVHTAFHGRRIVGLCTYWLERCPFDSIIDVAHRHDVVLVREHGQWRSLRNIGLGNGADGTTTSSGARRVIVLFDSADSLEGTTSGNEAASGSTIQAWAERDRRSLLALEAVTAVLARARKREEIANALADLCPLFGARRIVIEAAPATQGPAESPSAPSGLQQAETEPDPLRIEAARAEWLTDQRDIAARYPNVDRDCAALAALPLATDSRYFGSIFFVFGTSASFDAQERVFLETAARQVASALDRAELREETEREHRLRDELVATLSHELRNPLASISAINKR